MFLILLSPDRKCKITPNPWIFHQQPTAALEFWFYSRKVFIILLAGDLVPKSWWNLPPVKWEELNMYKPDCLGYFKAISLN